MNPWQTHLVPVVALIAAAGSVMAQDKPDAFDRIIVSVIGANGPLLTINRGMRNGIHKGDTVVFRRSGERPYVGVVRRADKNQSKVELENLEVGEIIEVGLRGQVLVPRDRAIPDGMGSQGPEHPEWKEPVGPWKSGTPLLAPATSPEAQERPSEFNGRVYSRYQVTDDSLNHRTTSRLLSGLDIDWDNPFAHGGTLRFKGDLSFRNDDSANFNGKNSISRVQRFSYSHGDSYSDPQHLEVGRFLHTIFPEFGLIDGAEYVTHLSARGQLGAAVGFQPDYTDDLSTTDNLSTATFYRWVDSQEEIVSLSFGFQKTWFDGQPDRDLLASSFQWLVNPLTTLRGSVLVDYYDSSAQIESKGLGLTEFHGSLDRRFGSVAGANVYVSYFDWPELLRDKFPTPPTVTISDQQVKRGGINTWARLAKNIRVYGRMDVWTDNQSRGAFGDLRVDMRDLFYDNSELSLGIFDTEGAFSNGLGYRIRHTYWSGPTTLRASLESATYHQSGFLGSQSDLSQHTLQLGLDTRLGSDLDLSADAIQRFGDAQDSLVLGLRLTWRF